MGIIGPLRIGNLKQTRIQKRQENVRLTQQQRDALDEALSPHDLENVVVEKIEDALDYYRYRRDTSKKYPQRPLRRATLRRLRAARALYPHLGFLGEHIAKPLKRFVDRLTSLANDQKHDAQHRPTDEERLVLALWTAWALDDGGFPLKAGRRDASVFVRVLQLVLGWADEIDGHAPRRRNNLYRFASIVVQKYEPYRKKVETRMRASERRWKNIERRQQRSQNTSRPRRVK